MAELDPPEHGPDELLVAVKAVGLNPADYKIAKGGHPAWTYPFIMGLDVAGTVESVGSECSSWKVGDEIYYHGDFTRPGGFAELTTIPGHAVSPLPKGLSFIEAASVPCAGFAAYQAAFRKLNGPTDITVLIEGGAGGVGGFAVQLGAHLGWEVIATTSAQNSEYVRELGANHLIDYTAEDVAKRVLELTSGRGVEAVIDTVSQETTTRALGLIAFGGQVVCVDSLPNFEQIRPFSKAFSLHEIALGVAHLSGDRLAQLDLARIGSEMGELLTRGAVQPTVSEVISLSEVPEALERIAGRHVRGKIVAQINSE